MAALGWLLNLGFAAGETSQVVAPPVDTVSARGGFGLPLIVRPIKRHKKLETFREELERLILGVEREIVPIVPEEHQESVKQDVLKQADTISERFNIVQTFDDQGIISGQMELLWQDLQSLSSLIQSFRRTTANQARNNEEEAIMLILAMEVL